MADHTRAERFRGADLARVADRARRSLGDDVMILHSRMVRNGGVPMVEVLAAPSFAIDQVRNRLAPRALPATLRRAAGLSGSRRSRCLGSHRVGRRAQ
jgi:flagellar biosynthesis protein FlhF